MKVLLELILVLQLSVISGQFVYYGHGQEAVLPCGDHPPDSCSNILWLNVPGSGRLSKVVEEGKVLTDTQQSARLRINADCSLVINNVTAEDVGLYTCRQGTDTSLDQSAIISVLTLSPSPPDADPNGELTLTCSLSIHEDTVICEKDSIRWLDEAGGELKADVDSELQYPPDNPRKRDCVSVLTGQNRNRTCQFVHDDKVEVEVHYTPDFTKETASNPEEENNNQSPPSSPGHDSSGLLRSITVSVGLAALIVIVVMVKVWIRTKERKTQTDDNNASGEAAEGVVTYENVGEPAVRFH